MLLYRFGIEDLGWPCQRCRFLGWSIKDSKLVWIGPKSSADILTAFRALFASQRQLECDVFCGTDSEECRYALYEGLGRNRGIYFRPGVKVGDLDMEKLLPPSTLKHYREGLVDFDKAAGMGGSYCRDLSQTSHFKRDGPVLPTLQKSTMMFCYNKSLMFTDNELEFSQGWPCLPQSEKFAGCVHHRIEKFPMSSRRNLRGNGMHLACIATWLQYCFANTVRRQHYDGFWCGKFLLSEASSDRDGGADDSEDDQPSAGDAASSAPPVPKRKRCSSVGETS